MSVIKKLVTLLRGSARELGQSMVDANATRIYEQEITDAKASIGQAKTELTGVMAQQMQTAREIERIKADVLRHENMALQALDKQKDDLALEVAARVATLEAELQAQTEAHAAYALQVSRLKDLIRSAEARVREHEREIGIAKTTESVYRATQSISESMGASGSKLTSARESLERIRKRHEELADRMAAAEELDADALGCCMETDGPLPAQYRCPDVAEALQAEVWGQGFPAPLFCDEVQVISQRLVGGEKHLSLKLRHAGETVDAIWFNHTGPLPERPRLAYRLDVDEWQGQRRVRFIVEAAEGESLE